MIKKYKAYFKIEPYFEIDTEEEDFKLEDLESIKEDKIIDIFTDMSMNIYDYIGFEEVK